MLLSNFLFVLSCMTAMLASPWPQPAPTDDVHIYIHLTEYQGMYDQYDTAVLLGN